LELFARIKGVEPHQIPALVESKMKEMDLVDFHDKTAGSLSGGNQRKLSVAIATVAEPPVLFLDEPSTGETCRGGGNSRSRRRLVDAWSL